MSRINTNVAALLAARNLAKNQSALNTALERLSTGLRINTGKDDPAGLIASENLRSEKTAISAAIDNANRANNMVSVAEGALQEVNDLLIELENLVDRTANDAALSDEEVQANQLQIDSILDTINRIASSTSFQGKKLLNGSLDYTVSGVSSSNLSKVQVNAAKLPEGGSRTVVVEVTTSAQTANVTFTGDGLSASNNVTIRITGNYGTELLSFAGSTTVSAMAFAINQVKEITGVSATTSSNGADYLRLDSTTYGSDALVSVEFISDNGNFEAGFSATRDTGVDAEVLINGTQAITDGLDASVRTSNLSVDLTMTSSFGTATGTTTFTVTGGGADFSLAPEVSMAGKESVGISSVTTSSLGNAELGYLSSLGTGQTNQLSSKNFTTAQRIIRAAIKQVSSLRGRLGAFQKNTLQSTINSLQVALENTVAAESAIRDADFAAEASNLTRAQILVQSSTSVLQLANQAPQNVLALLR